MSTSFTQTTIYFPSNESPFVSTGNVISANVSGLGASQCILVTAEALLAIGQVISLPIQVSVPPPLLYLSTANAGDILTIQSPDGLVINTDPNAAGVGFNGSHFQPSSGGRYIIYYKASVASVIGATLLSMQAVLENTIGQFINMSTIAFGGEEEGKRPVISQSIALNTISAVPNTMNIDFDRIRIRKGLNVLATFRIMVNSTGVESWGKDYLSVVGSATKSVQLVAGQNYSAVWYSNESGVFSGRYSLTISQSGSLTLPSTCSAYASADMFPSLVSNTPELFTIADAEIERAHVPGTSSSTQSNVNPYQMDELSGLIKSLSSVMATIESKTNKLIQDCFKRNDEAHSYQNAKLTELMHLVSPHEILRDIE